MIWDFSFLSLCVILDPNFSVGNRLEVRISIKPRSPNGTIFSVTDTPKGDFLSMEMINGVVSIACYFRPFEKRTFCVQDLKIPTYLLLMFISEEAENWQELQ